VDKSLHFLEAVDALSFSDNGTFATCGNTRNDYHGNEAANDFMGPVLWPANPSDFADMGKSDASKVHLDMMHDTPLCMGIAASGGNTYYVFNGVKGSIDWYDFGVPHENGGDDHTDGIKKRYIGMGLKRVDNVPSHLAFDAASGLLYIADTGNGRIVRLDTQTGTKKSTLKTYPDEVKMTVESGETFDVLVGEGLQQPSGILLHEGFLYVTDSATGILHAYTLDGLAVRELDSGLGDGVLAGLAAGVDDKLYFVDRKQNQILRLDP
jgi:DNA-binding beta-propeller fold protein YncE